MRIYSTVASWSSKMTNLVQILTTRQFKMTNQHHLLAASYDPRLTRWDPGTICARQLWGCSAYPALDCHRPALCHKDAVHCLRFKSSRRKKASRTKAQDSDDEDDSDDEKEDEDSDEEDEPDPSLPEGYKDLERVVQSFRFDLVMKAGLDMARNKIEDGLYGGKLRLNGQTLVKKSKKVKAGDTLDLIMSENKEANTVQLRRVILRKVLWESSEEEKYKVSLRRWKVLELPSEKAFQTESRREED